VEDLIFGNDTKIKKKKRLTKSVRPAMSALAKGSTLEELIRVFSLFPSILYAVSYYHCVGGEGRGGEGRGGESFPINWYQMLSFCSLR